MPFIAEILGQHIARLSREPSSVVDREMALKCMLDLVGTAIAGRNLPGPAAVRRTVSNIYGPGNASIWATGMSVSAGGALIANASAACALDLDDGNRLARGHAGACVIPTVLTLLPTCNASAADVYSAISVGYDVGVRVASAQMPATIRTRQTGRWAAVAAAAATGRLFRSNADEIARSLTISAVLAPNQLANGSSGYSRMTGNDVKEGIAWSCLLGLNAHYLGANGYTGPQDVFDHPDYYDRDAILSGLGRHSHLSGTYFKRYACCRYIHAALDAYFDLVEEHQIDECSIAGIEVETFSWALKLGNKTRPLTIVDIQYSLPYCMAIAVLEGRGALAPIEAELLGREDLSTLAEKVKVTINSDIDGLFPSETLARVTVDHTGGRSSSAIRGPLGDPQRPMSFDAIEDKFMKVTGRQLPYERQRAIIDGVLDFDADGGSGLLAALQ
ncbi:hypothetical protein LPJGGPFB_05080 [Ensifer adhaerens]|uniref:MmgE/PrpD family protein n=1 Tax=Ensifer adhaerens TaxID=106592 RepID=UPI00156850CA|nr:MmgE/PrpD family protein [Ensifer adhaerens]NRP21821.1 hypothetical protein [Ensifer adhaerens]